jgi:hypothetical protein
MDPHPTYTDNTGMTRNLLFKSIINIAPLHLHQKLIQSTGFKFFGGGIWSNLGKSGFIQSHGWALAA